MEACEYIFKSYKQRKEHLIKDHAYPRNYFFAVTKFGIDRRQSMLVDHRRGKTSQHRGSPERRKNQSQGVKATVENCETGESNDMPMADAARFAKEEEEAVEDVTMVETGQAAGMAFIRKFTGDKATKSLRAKAPERQAIQDSTAIDAEIDGITSAMSSLKFVPRVIRLGPKQQPRR